MHIIGTAFFVTLRDAAKNYVGGVQEAREALNDGRISVGVKPLVKADETLLVRDGQYCIQVNK